MRRQLFLSVLVALLCIATASAQRFTDALDRGLVAVPSGSGYLVTWRIFAEEYYDVTYNLYRGSTLIAEGLSVSNYLDSDGSSSDTYSVAPVVDGTEGDKCEAVTPWTSLHTAVTVTTPYDRDGTDVTDYYTLNEISLGDVNGDGVSEFLIKRPCNDPSDTSQSVRFHRYEMYDINSNLLWWIDMGPNCISLADHQWDIVLYDWDEDGKCEAILRGRDNMIIHTASGYGNGSSSDTLVIGDPTVDTRYSGMSYTCTGNEYLLYLNGETGVPYEIGDSQTPRYIEFPIPIGTDYGTDWGDSYGHRGTKIFMGAPFLDGRNASMFFARGIYTKTEMRAYDVDKSTHQLTLRWSWSSGSSGDWYGQGYHNFAIADVDMDGRDEIVYGSMVIDDNGKGLSTTGLGHGDAQHCTDLDPYRWGLEQFACLEESPYGMNYRNATTGEKYVYQTADGDDGRCLAGNFSNDYPGAMGRSVATLMISCVSDEDLSSALSSSFANTADDYYKCNYRLYWKGDLTEQYLYSKSSEGWGMLEDLSDGRLTVDATYYVSTATSLINSTKNQPCATGDVLGDWREEIIMRTSDNTAFYIFHTNYETDYRIPTLWHDHQYRQAMVWQCEGYNQPPHPSFFLGELEGITTAPPPLTNRDRTEIANGGTISSAYDGTHVMVCETNSTAITVSEGANPSVATFNVPSWVQGNDDNDAITYTYYSCVVSGGAFGGDTRLVKQGEGILSLPDVTQEYTGNTDVWGGTLQFSGSLPNSALWLNRHTTLETSGGTFRSIKADYNSTLQIGGTGTASSVTVDSLYLGFGSRVLIDIDGSSATALDALNAGYISVETKSWTYGPTYSAPVFQFNNTGSTLSAGWYAIGTVSAVNGDLGDIVIEGIDTSAFDHAYITSSNNTLYLVLINTTAATVTEGTYYFKDASEYKFLTRGGNWGTELIYGDVGMRITVEASTSTSGAYVLSAPDTRIVKEDASGYIFGTDGLYQDGASSSQGLYYFETDDDGNLYWLNADGDFLVPTAVVVNDYHTYYYMAASSTPTVAWELLSDTEYDSVMNARLDDYAAEAAEALELEATSVSTLLSALSDEGYTESDVTSTYITNADYSDTSGEGWTLVQTNASRTIDAASYSSNSAELWSSPGALIQQVSLPEGLYKIDVNAMSRAFAAADYTTYTTLAAAASDAAYVYVKAGTTEYVTKAGSWTDYDGYTNVNSMSDFYTYGDNYQQTLYFYTDGEEDVVIGFVKPYFTEGAAATDGTIYSYSWGIVNGWTLTYFAPAPYDLGDAQTSVEDGGNVSVNDFDGTFTVIYADAMSTEDDATLQILNSSASITLSDGTTSYTGTASVADYDETGDGKVLSIDFGDVTLTAGTTYTISIPAGMYGYTSDYANEAITVTFTATLEGDYYLQVDGDYQFWTRGGNYGTESIRGEHGVVLSVEYVSDGEYRFRVRDRESIFSDSWGYVSGPTSSYMNQYVDNAATWTFEDASDGSCYIKNSNGNYVSFTAYAYSDYYTYYYLSETTDQGSAAVFTLLSEDAYDALLQERVDGYASAAAASAGMTVDTEDALESRLEDDSWTESDCTSSITDADCTAGSGWTLAQIGYISEGVYAQYNSGALETWNAPGAAYQTISGLTAGLYRLSVTAWSVPALYTTIEDVSNTSYFYARTASSESKKRIHHIEGSDASGPALSTLTGDTDGTYLNTLYIYVADGETLEIGYVQEGLLWYSWTAATDWQLTLLAAPESLSVTVTTLQYSTLYYGDYNLRVPDGVTAYTVSSLSDGTAVLTSIDQQTGYDGPVIPQGTGVVLHVDETISEATDYAFPVESSAPGLSGENLLRGTDDGLYIEYNADTLYYVLSYSQDDMSDPGFFYSSTDGHALMSSAHHAYLPVAADSDAAVKGFTFAFSDDTATGISTANTDVEAPQGVYTVTGVRLDDDTTRLPAGLYIINGKKILIR